MILNVLRLIQVLCCAAASFCYAMAGRPWTVVFWGALCAAALSLLVVDWRRSER